MKEECCTQNGGIYDTMDEYLANEGIGSSDLKNILHTPKDYFYARKRKSKQTASTTKGTLWHSFILERNKYFEQYMIQPEDWGSLNKNPGKKMWDDFKNQAKEAGKTPVKFSDGHLCIC